MGCKCGKKSKAAEEILPLFKTTVTGEESGIYAVYDKIRVETPSRDIKLRSGQTVRLMVASAEDLIEHDAPLRRVM